MKNFVPTLSSLLDKENLGLYQMMKYHFGIDNLQDSNSSHNFPLGVISELFCNHFSIDIKNSNLISSSLELLNASFEVHEDVRNGNTERFSKESLIIYQTFNPSDETLKNILENDSAQFLEDEINLRKEKNLPPFTRLIALIISSKEIYLDVFLLLNA